MIATTLGISQLDYKHDYVQDIRAVAQAMDARWYFLFAFPNIVLHKFNDPCEDYSQYENHICMADQIYIRAGYSFGFLLVDFIAVNTESHYVLLS